MACILASPARAGVEVTSTTVLHARPEIRAGESAGAAPLLELMRLDASGLGNPLVDDLRLQVAAWGALRFLELGDRRPASGDVDLAFASGRVLDKRLTLTLGRHFVFGGSARATHLDGLSADLRVWRGISLRAWGGTTVLPRFGFRTGDASTGLRVSWSPSYTHELGASFAWVLDRGISASQNLGIDGRWLPRPGVTVTGLAVLSLLERRFAELDLSPRWQLRPDLELSAGYRRTSPDLFIPRSSIFSVFADTARDELGAGATWQPLPRLAVFADARAVWVEQGAGIDTGGQASLRLGRFARTLVGAQLRRLDVPGSGYLRGRAYARHTLPSKLQLAIEADTFRLDEPVNGERYSVSGLAAASYPFARDWQATLSAGAGSTPTFTRAFEVLAKVQYRFFTRLGETGP